MSKIKNNPLLKGASGMFGDLIVYREVAGNVVMSNRPKKSGILTLQQTLARARFLEAVQYAKGQLKNPESQAEYAAGVNEKLVSAYSVAMADYLKAPQILSVDLGRYNGEPGGLIIVRAIDDFKVVAVRVEIRTSDDVLIERGDAVIDPNNNLSWTFEAAVLNASLPGTKVTISVADKPGNVTQQTVELM